MTEAGNLMTQIFMSLHVHSSHLITQLPRKHLWQILAKVNCFFTKWPRLTYFYWNKVSDEKQKQPLPTICLTFEIYSKCHDRVINLGSMDMLYTFCFLKLTECLIKTKWTTTHAIEDFCGFFCTLNLLFSLVNFIIIIYFSFFCFCLPLYLTTYIWLNIHIVYEPATSCVNDSPLYVSWAKFIYLNITHIWIPT